MLPMVSLLLLAAVVSSPPAESRTRARFLMGTICEITSPDARETEAAFAEAARIERELLSTWKEESELARLNARRGMQVSPELWQLLSTAREWSEKTGGAFNPLIRPLIDCWQTRKEGALPSMTALTAAREKTELANLTFPTAQRVVLLNGATLEEGAFGKGYALDRMLSLFADSPRAVLNFGGQISVKGRATVTVADPRRRDHPIAELTLADGSLSTSSGSERSFAAGGRTLSHILDPRSGEALAPRGSVSVIASSGFEADILSTALYVMGSAAGLRWSNANGVAAAFVDTDHSIQLSGEFRRRAEDFTLVDSHFHIKE